jgi:hypothetical protein
VKTEVNSETADDLRMSVVVEGDPFRGVLDDEEVAISDEAVRRGFVVETCSLKKWSEPSQLHDP